MAREAAALGQWLNRVGRETPPSKATTMAPDNNRVQGPLYSSLAHDPDMAELLGMFVDDLPDRVQMLLDQLQASDSEGLWRTAHQLSGAAGSYGFQEITVEAASLEGALREGRPEQEIAAAVNSLVDLCRRARAGDGMPQADAQRAT